MKTRNNYQRSMKELTYAYVGIILLLIVTMITQ